MVFGWRQQQQLGLEDRVYFRMLLLLLQGKRQKRTMGALRRMALAADVELDSDASGGETDEDQRIKTKRKNQNARKKLRQVSCMYTRDNKHRWKGTQRQGGGGGRERKRA